MDEPEYFTVMEDYAVFRPVGRMALEEVERLGASAIDFARENQIRKLLMVTNDVITEFEPTDLAKRYFFIKHWAHAARGEVCIASVPRLESLDFERIGVTIAENEGLRVGAFECEEEALAWLERIKWVAEDGKIQFTRG